MELCLRYRSRADYRPRIPSPLRFVRSIDDPPSPPPLAEPEHKNGRSMPLPPTLPSTQRVRGPKVRLNLRAVWNRDRRAAAEQKENGEGAGGVMVTEGPLTDEQSGEKTLPEHGESKGLADDSVAEEEWVDAEEGWVDDDSSLKDTSADLNGLGGLYSQEDEEVPKEEDMTSPHIHPGNTATGKGTAISDVRYLIQRQRFRKHTQRMFRLLRSWMLDRPTKTQQEICRVFKTCLFRTVRRLRRMWTTALKLGIWSGNRTGRRRTEAYHASLCRQAFGVVRTGEQRSGQRGEGVGSLDAGTLKSIAVEALAQSSASP